MNGPILITDCTLLQDAGDTPRDRCYIRIEGDSIAAVGSMQTCPDTGGYHVIDGAGRLALPGLVNAHGHSGMTLFRGLADDLELKSWLYDHIFPAEKAHVDSETVYWGTKLAAAEMIMSGTTCVADGYFFSDRAAAALHDAGMRAVVAHGVLDFPTPSVPDPANSLDSVRTFVENWLDRSPRITPAVFAHSPYTCSNTTLQNVKSEADRNNLRFFIHVAESSAEIDMIAEPQGPSPIMHLARLGLLDANSACVHSIWLDDSDIETVARHDAAVITCPQSNMKLAAGIARVPEMLENGITIGLGTDGAASNNRLDMFREMDGLFYVDRLHRPGQVPIDPQDIIEFATVSGSRAIGVENCGRLTPGSRADLILVDTIQPHLTPQCGVRQVVSAVSGSDVVCVIIDGSVVLHDRRILSFDLDEVYERIRWYSDQLKARS